MEVLEAAEHGLEIDPALNAAARGDAVISPPGAAVATIVVPAREDLEIAAGTRSVLSRSGRAPETQVPGPARAAPGKRAGQRHSGENDRNAIRDGRRRG
jgi:hypothetical protein